MITVSVVGRMLQKRLPRNLPRSLLGACHSVAPEPGENPGPSTAPGSRGPSSHHLDGGGSCSSGWAALAEVAQSRDKLSPPNPAQIAGLGAHKMVLVSNH